MNYASFDASALDAVFGTYMGSLAGAGEKLEDPARGAPARLDARATLWGAPALKDVAFLPASAARLAPWMAACGGGGAGAAAAGPARAYALGALAGAGPVALA